MGCVSNKNKNAAVGPPPPASAYPTPSGAIPSGAPGAVPSVPSQATMAATNHRSSAPAPAPFSLREGEQLVPHQIQSGENLSAIAKKYNTTVGRILSANGMTDTKIIAGKSIQVPTSAPPTNLAQGSPSSGNFGAAAPAAPGFSAPAGGTYPSTMPPPGAPVVPTAPTVPSAPSYPAISNTPGAISAPPVPQAQSGTLPGYPSSTSYPRPATAPATSTGAAPTPSFEASRIQFSN